MKVSDILRVKGNTLYTVTPDTPLAKAVALMAEQDIGSSVVMEYGELVGMLTFREVISRIHANGGSVGEVSVRKVMDDAPLTVTPATRPCWISIFDTSLRMRTSTPLRANSSCIRPTSRSVPPWNVKTPFDMKFEKTMP